MVSTIVQNLQGSTSIWVGYTATIQCNLLVKFMHLAMDAPSMDDAIEKLGDLLNISSKVRSVLIGCL